MSIFRTQGGVIIREKSYTTKNEKVLVVKPYEWQKEGDVVNITLNHNASKHITIKSVTDCVIDSSHSFDGEFDEIILNKFASVELINLGDVWYILSSDGLKNS